MDYIHICLEEIALEGLDGITIAGLWVRLLDRKSGFHINLDEKSKPFLWKSIVAVDGIDFYQLEKPRPLIDINFYRRFEEPSTDCGTCNEVVNESMVDVYPICPVKDVFGSCETYHTRKCVSDVIRCKTGQCCPLQEVLKKYDEHSLVIVASLDRRQRALFGPECPLNIILSERQYVFLERVGRSRHYGEVTHVKNSLMTICENNSKALFYIKTILIKHNLIKSEPISVRTAGGQNTPGNVLHLVRYHEKRVPVMHLHLEKLCKMLSRKPNQMEIVSKMREQMKMSEKVFKKVLVFGQKYAVCQNVPYREMYPFAAPKEYQRKAIPDVEKQVRVLKLLKMYEYHSDDDGGGDADDEVDLDDYDEDNTNMAAAERKKFGKFEYVMDRPMLQQVYDYVLRKGPLGVTQRELSVVMGLGKLEARLLCRNMQRMNVVKMMLQDEGRQRVQTYVARMHEEQSELTTKYEMEKKRILQHAKDNAAALSASSKTSKQEDDSAKTSKPAESEAATEKRGQQKSPDLASMFVSTNSNELTTLKKKHGHVTFRVLKRANMIIEAVREAKILDRFSIQKKIIQDEDREGLKIRLDRKSLERLIERLAREGQIKSIRTVLKYGKTQKRLHFICEPTMAPDDPLLLSAIEQAKRKYIALPVTDMKDKNSTDKGDLAIDGSRMSLKNKNVSLLPRSTVRAEDLEYDAEAGKRYGYLPKMKRLQTVHEMIAYLVYHYEGSTQENEIGVQQPLGYDGSVPFFKNEMSWKRYVPSLPKHKGCQPGWCLISDLILITPVIIFCRITRINYKIPGLLVYIDHPVKKFTLIRDLPTSMQAQLYYARKYIFSYYEKCTWLCQMGLLSFGPREMKEKDQIFIYLHKNATVIDTTTSHVGWSAVSSERDFPVKKYCFENKSDVEKYWFDLQCICVNTPLGAHQQGCRTEKTESKALKKEDRQRAYQRLLPCQESRTPETLLDNGSVPGDGIGAGGLDSSFFSHLKRNWTWNPRDVKVEWLILKAQQLTESGTVTGKKEQKKSKDIKVNTAKKILWPKPGGATVDDTSDKKRLTAVKMVKGKPRKGGKGIKRKAEDSAIARKYKVKRVRSDTRKIYPKKPYYDADDREALCRMTKERVEWTAQEDSLLLLCNVASMFLGSHRRDFLVPWKFVRDTMHQHMKCSLDKTSKACQRRVTYVMKNETTRQNVMVYLAEIMQDQAIVKEFKTGKTYKRTDEETISKAFHDLLPILKQKFSSAKYLHNAPDLPLTMQELQERFTLSTIGDLSEKSVHKDVARVKDIYFSVVHNLIHSTLSLSDKIGRALELYKLFSQYPESLLDEVFTNMNNDGIITKIKGGPLKRHKDKSVNMLSIGSYQMAQRYDYVFISRYPKTVFPESKECFDVLLQRLAESKKTRKDGQKDKGFEVTLTESGGYCAAVVSLMALNKLVFDTMIPEKVIVVDTQNMEKQIVGRGNMMKPITESDAEDEELIQQVDNEHKSSAKGKLASTSQFSDVTDTDLDSSTGFISTSSIREEASAALANLRADNSESPRDQSRSAKQITQVSTASGSKVNFELSSKNASRIMLSLVHGQYLNTINVRNLNPQDHLVVNACRVNIKLKDKTVQNDEVDDDLDENVVFEPRCNQRLELDRRVSKKTLDELRIVQPSRLDFTEFLDTCRTLLRYTESEIRLITDMYKYIKSYKSFGITNLQFKDKYREEGSCLKHLHVLLCHRVIE